MKRSNLILMALLVIIAAEIIWVWRQHGTLEEKRAQQQTRMQIATHRADITEKQVRALEQQLAALRRDDARQSRSSPAKTTTVGYVADRTGGRAVPPLPVARPSALSRTPFGLAMQDPKFREFVAVRQRERLDVLYREIFNQLSLRSEKLEALKDLLVQKQQALGDASRAASDLGYGATQIPDNLNAVRFGLAAINTEIQQLLGPEAYAAFDRFEATGGARAMVDRLQNSLSYTTEPLTPDQARQLADVIFDRTPPDKRQYTMGYGAQVGAALTWPNYRAPIPNDAIMAAEAFLSAGQVEALRQLKARYDAEEVLAKVKH